MMGTATHARWAIPALASLLILLAGPAARAAACTTQEEAIDQYKELVRTASQRMRAESEPATLQKDKIGSVLVARAAPSREIDQNALRRDINALAQDFNRAPGEFCRAVESIRRAHGL